MNPNFHAPYTQSYIFIRIMFFLYPASDLQRLIAHSINVVSTVNLIPGILTNFDTLEKWHRTWQSKMEEITRNINISISYEGVNGQFHINMKARPAKR